MLTFLKSILITPLMIWYAFVLFNSYFDVQTVCKISTYKYDHHMNVAKIRFRSRSSLIYENINDNVYLNESL